MLVVVVVVVVVVYFALGLQSSSPVATREAPTAAELVL